MLQPAASHSNHVQFSQPQIANIDTDQNADIDPLAQFLQDLMKLEEDIKNGDRGDLQADYDKFIKDGKALVNSEGSKFPAFSVDFEEMLNNPNDPLAKYIQGGGQTDPSKALAELQTFLADIHNA